MTQCHCRSPAGPSDYGAESELSRKEKPRKPEPSGRKDPHIPLQQLSILKSPSVSVLLHEFCSRLSGSPICHLRVRLVDLLGHAFEHEVNSPVSYPVVASLCSVACLPLSMPPSDVPRILWGLKPCPGLHMQSWVVFRSQEVWAVVGVVEVSATSSC